MVNGVPREVLWTKPLWACGPSGFGLRPLGFWPWDLPRHSIHHGTPSAFQNNVPDLLARANICEFSCMNRVFVCFCHCVFVCL